MRRHPSSVGWTKRHPGWTLGLIGLIWLGSAWCALGYGQLGWLGPIDVGRELIEAFTGAAADREGVAVAMIEVRLNRIVLALLVGANLAMAGAIMQALFYNPMAEPYVVGVSAGGAFGAVLLITVFPSLAALSGVTPLASFAGAALTTFAVYRVAERQGRLSLATLLLTGIALGGLLQGATTYLLLRSDPFLTRNVLSWLMGSLAYRDWGHIFAILPGSILGLVLCALHVRSLNALATGEEGAHFLGFDVEKLKLFLLGVAALLAGMSVAVAGIVAFAGLVVPHVARMLLGASHAWVLPASALGGGILLVWSDVLARTLLPGENLPIGIITGAVGCAFFLVLLRQARGRVF